MQDCGHTKIRYRVLEFAIERWNLLLSTGIRYQALEFAIEHWNCFSKQVMNTIIFHQQFTKYELKIDEAGKNYILFKVHKKLLVNKLSE